MKSPLSILKFTCWKALKMYLTTLKEILSITLLRLMFNVKSAGRRRDVKGESISSTLRLPRMMLARVNLFKVIGRLLGT